MREAGQDGGCNGLLGRKSSICRRGMMLDGVPLPSTNEERISVISWPCQLVKGKFGMTMARALFSVECKFWDNFGAAINPPPINGVGRIFFFVEIFVVLN